MGRVNLGSTIINYPMPVVLIGSKTNKGKSDFLTVSWITMVSENPYKVLISLYKKHTIRAEIKENKAFSMCVPSKEQVKNVDYCGVVGMENLNKADFFHIFYGTLDGTPMIEECKLNAECKVEKIIDCGSHELFIGEILQVHVDDSVTSDKKVCLEKMQPMILDTDNKKYREVGNIVDDAFKKYK